jgi:hypothetical protein
MTTKHTLSGFRFTYSNVMSTVAVFFAIGGAGAVAATHLGSNTVGTPQLKAGAVTGAKVKDGTLTGADVNVASLGKVPAAAHADSAGTATRAGSAATAETAKLAETAASLSPPEAIHFVNQPGEPKSSELFTIGTRVGFYLDHEGVVHLQGVVEAKTDLGGFLTELPVAYRPAQEEFFYGIGPTAAAHARINAGGSLELVGLLKGERVILDGITWRAS